ncbi:MAG: hypothetical protein K9J06_08415 [Flavobacteriales bacterium]|nr:hypothetical protein [Flavobacteriales bacterium]
MQKFGKDETPQQLPVSKGRSTLLRAMLLELEVGESLFLPRAEWKTKNGPYYVIAYLKKTTALRFDYGFKTDGTGWLFKRIE